MVRRGPAPLAFLLAVAAVLVPTLALPLANSKRPGKRRDSHNALQHKHSKHRHHDDEVLEKEGKQAGHESVDMSRNASFPFVAENNLGGVGPVPFPSTHFMSMVIGNVATTKIHNVSVPITLVLMNLTEYTAGDITKNGLYMERYPSVNVYSTTNVTLRAVFVNNITGERVKLKRFIWSILALDCNLDSSGAEQVLSKEHTAYRVADSTNLKVERMTDGTMSFLATSRNADHYAPQDPLNMKPMDLGSSVAFIYEDVSEFTFTLQVKGPTPPNPGNSPYSRTFKFSTVSEMMLADLSEAEVLNEAQDVDIAGTPAASSALIFLFVLITFLCCVLLMTRGWGKFRSAAL